MDYSTFGTQKGRNSSKGRNTRQANHRDGRAKMGLAIVQQTLLETEYNVYIYLHIYIYIYVCVYKYIYICFYIYIFTCHIYIIYVSIYMCVCVCQ
jgi:hypothetical protein